MLERAHRNRRGYAADRSRSAILAELERLCTRRRGYPAGQHAGRGSEGAVERCSHGDGAFRSRVPAELRLENVRAYAETGVDFISVGALTHSAPAVDMQLAT